MTLTGAFERKIKIKLQRYFISLLRVLDFVQRAWEAILGL